MLIEAIKKDVGKPLPTQEIKEIWEPPSAGVVKLNTDASLASRDLTYFGAVFRDHFSQVWLLPVQELEGLGSNNLRGLYMLSDSD